RRRRGGTPRRRRRRHRARAAPPDLHVLPPGSPTRRGVALTLRLVAGLRTSEIARLFLVSEPTMAARLTRATRKIAASAIPFRVPDRSELPARPARVCAVTYLMFTEGYAATSGPDLLRPELCEEAIRVQRM